MSIRDLVVAVCVLVSANDDAIASSGQIPAGDETIKKEVAIEQTTPSKETSEPVTPAREIDEPPAVVKRVKVEMPARHVELCTNGSTVLVVTVGADGKTKEVSVQSRLADDLDKLAADALMGFEWRPAKSKGRAVRTKIRYRFNWKVDCSAWTEEVERAPPNPFNLLGRCLP